MSDAIKDLLGSREDGSPAKTLAICASMARLEAEWASAVGPKYATRTRPTSLDGTTLVVAADSSAVLSDIRFKKNAFIAAIRSRFHVMIDDIKFVIGASKPRAPQRRHRAERARATGRVPSEESVCRVRAALIERRGGIDGELADAIARCIAAKAPM